MIFNSNKDKYYSMSPFSFDISECKDLHFSKITIPSLISINNISNEIDLLIELFESINKDNLIEKNIPKLVLSVASFPRKNSDFLTQRALRTLDLGANLLIELGTNCASILDAIFLASKIQQKNSQIILASTDLFGSSFNVNGTNNQWLNGASGIVFGLGPLKLSIKSFSTLSDSKYVDLIEIEGTKPDRSLFLNSNDSFLQNDIPSEMAVVERAIEDAGLKWTDIDGYIAVNRSLSRYERLKECLPVKDIKIYQSKESFGHRGATDLLFNLQSCINSSAKDRLFLLLVGNGLGYTWSSMLVEITKC